MGTSLLRTIQVGAALFVVAVVALAILVVTATLTFDQALRIVGNVGAVLAILVAGGAVLIGVFGLGRPRDGDGPGERR